MSRPEKPLAALSDFLKTMSELFEGEWIEGYHDLGAIRGVPVQVQVQTAEVSTAIDQRTEATEAEMNSPESSQQSQQPASIHEDDANISDCSSPPPLVATSLTEQSSQTDESTRPVTPVPGSILSILKPQPSQIIASEDRAGSKVSTMSLKNAPLSAISSPYPPPTPPPGTPEAPENIDLTSPVDPPEPEAVERRLSELTGALHEPSAVSKEIVLQEDAGLGHLEVPKAELGSPPLSSPTCPSVSGPEYGAVGPSTDKAEAEADTAAGMAAPTVAALAASSNTGVLDATTSESTTTLPTIKVDEETSTKLEDWDPLDDELFGPSPTQAEMRM